MAELVRLCRSCSFSCQLVSRELPFGSDDGEMLASRMSSSFTSISNLLSI